MNSSENFLATKIDAVAGASARTLKYGYDVLKALLASDRGTYPLNPVNEKIHGHKTFPRIVELPVVPEVVSIITPPEVTLHVIADAIETGVTTSSAEYILAAFRNPTFLKRPS